MYTYKNTTESTNEDILVTFYVSNCMPKVYYSWYVHKLLFLNKWYENEYIMKEIKCLGALRDIIF